MKTHAHTIPIYEYEDAPDSTKRLLEIFEYLLKEEVSDGPELVGE